MVPAMFSSVLLATALSGDAASPDPSPVPTLAPARSGLTTSPPPLAIVGTLARPWETPPPPPLPPPPRLMSRAGEISLIGLGLATVVASSLFMPRALICVDYLDKGFEPPCGLITPPYWANAILLGAGLGLTLGGTIPLVLDERELAATRRTRARRTALRLGFGFAR